MRLKISALFLAAAAVLAGAGCTSLSYVPSEPIPVPKASGAPLPLSVGVSYGAKSSGGQDLNRSRVNAATSFTEALRASGLFREVRAAGALADADLTISGDFDLSYVIDQGMGGKVGLCMLIVPGFFVTFTDNYAAAATLDVRDASGRTIKQYNEKATVDATYQMFSEGIADRQSPPMLIQNLVAKLVADLIQDRPLLQRAAAASNGATESSAAGTEPGADQKSWWK